MIGQDLGGWSMLDAFGGSGLMALEAWSRGADPVWVVERDRRAAEAIRRNIEGSGVRLVVGDAARVGGEADLVWLDPPYREDIATWLRAFGGRARRILAAEARAGADFPRLDGWALDTARAWGDSAVALYVRVGTEAEVAEAEVVGEDLPVVEAEGR